MDISYSVVKSWPIEEIRSLYIAAGWWQESEKARAAILPMIAGSFCFIVATDGKKTVGMGRVISDGVSDGYIQDVVVLPEYRGYGIGKKIIVKLTEECQKSGVVWIGLVAEPGTPPFYEKIGFRQIEGFVPMRFPTKELP